MWYFSSWNISYGLPHFSIHENGVKTIAFPAISCGIYGYPANQAALIAVKETVSFLETQEDKQIEEVLFVCFDDPVYEAYQFALDSLDK